MSVAYEKLIDFEPRKNAFNLWSLALAAAGLVSMSSVVWGMDNQTRRTERAFLNQMRGSRIVHQ